MKKENEIIVIDKDNNKIICKVLSQIDIEDKKYLIYTDNKKLYASGIKEINENITLIPIIDDYVWNKLETEFKRLCQESAKLSNKDTL